MYSISVLVAIAIVIFIGWRLASRRQSLPCPVWLHWLVELNNPFAKETRAAVIIEHLDLTTGMAVADVGCGPGRITIPLAEKIGNEGTVVALDIQTGMLKRAEAKAKQAGISNIQFVQAGAGEGKLEKSHFDRALLVTVLGEIPKQEPAIKEIYDALKPGGILSISETVFDPHYQRKATVINLAEKIGFRLKQFFGNTWAYTLQFEKPTST